MKSTMDHIEPLEPELWLEQIEAIARGDLGLEQSLRHACHLLQLTPTPFREVLHLAVAEIRFEDLLTAQDYDAAARHLIASPTALSVDSANQEFSATISCVILGQVIRGTGSSQATAILSAWTTCLLALKSAYNADLSALSSNNQGSENRALNS